MSDEGRQCLQGAPEASGRHRRMRIAGSACVVLTLVVIFTRTFTSYT